MVSIAASSYLIIFSDRIFSVLEKYLDIFERDHTHGEAAAQHDYELHCMRVHNGAHCDCEVGDPARFLRADDPGFTAGPPPF